MKPEEVWGEKGVGVVHAVPNGGDLNKQSVPNFQKQ